MIASPKVATYDKQPSMSVQSVADKVAEVVKADTHEFVMCNFAPPDMVRFSFSYALSNPPSPIAHRRPSFIHPFSSYS